MNKKQLIVAWSTKALAFVLDIIILFVIITILEIIILIPLRQANIGFLTVFERYLDIIFILGYFYLTPKLVGNTLGRKILKIQDKFNIFWTWPFLREKEDFPKKHLKRDEVLKVITKDGRWICPSCGNSSLEVYIVCRECGQEVEIQNEI